MSIETVEPPALEPISLAEAKKHARAFEDLTDDDDYIASLIVAAREKVEAMTHRAFINRILAASFDAFPAGRDPLRFGVSPLQAVGPIAYVDAQGVDQVLAPSAYEVKPGTPGVVRPARGTTWPAGASDVVVTLVAGFGADPADVPELAKLCIKYLVAHWYDRREPIVTGTIVAAIPYTVEALADPLRRGVYPR